MKSTIVVATIGAVLGLTACRGIRAPAQTESFASQAPAPVAAEPTPARTETPASPKQRAEGEAQETLTNEQVAAILDAINRGEIALGKLAEKVSKDARVKKFAAMMVRDHGEADRANEALFKKVGLSPTPSPTSRKLEKDESDVAARLRNETGADFDRDYVEAMVTGHREALGVIDQRLVPEASNAELKRAIGDFRPKLEAHLAEAQSLQATLVAKR